MSKEFVESALMQIILALVLELGNTHVCKTYIDGWTSILVLDLDTYLYFALIDILLECFTHYTTAAALLTKV